MIIQQGTEKDGGNTPSKPPSTPKRFPESVPNEGIFQNPFAHLSTASQKGFPNSSIPESSVHAKDTQPSPPSKKLKSSTSFSEALNAWATKPSSGKNASTEPSGGLFNFAQKPSPPPSNTKIDIK